MCIDKQIVESKLCELILDMQAVGIAVNAKTTDIESIKEKCKRLYDDWQELKYLMRGIEELEGPDYDAIINSFLE